MQIAACMSSVVARNGPHAMSDLSPLSDAKGKSDFGAVKAAFDRRVGPGNFTPSLSQIRT